MIWVFQYVGKDGCFIIRDVELYSSEEAALRRAKEWETKNVGADDNIYKSKYELTAYERDGFRKEYEIFQREVN